MLSSAIAKYLMHYVNIGRAAFGIRITFNVIFQIYGDEFDSVKSYQVVVFEVILVALTEVHGAIGNQLSPFNINHKLSLSFKLPFSMPSASPPKLFLSIEIFFGSGHSFPPSDHFCNCDSPWAPLPAYA